MRLNQTSELLINNIEISMKVKYPQYAISKEYGGDWRLRVLFLNVTRRDTGGEINKYLFCPGPSGEIASISIYGVALQGHYNTISQSRKIFGLPVEDICIDREGLSEFVDITLGDYSGLVH